MVVDSPDRPLAPVLDGEVVIAVQEQPRGTAGRGQGCRRPYRRREHGDRAGRRRAARHLRDAARAGRCARAVGARRGRSPPPCSKTRRDTGASSAPPTGRVERVVETKAPGDATEGELHIREVNTGIFAFDGARAARGARTQVRSENAQGEFYLPGRPSRSSASLGPTMSPIEVADPAVTLGDQRSRRRSRRSGRSRSGASMSATCSPA